MNSVSSVSPAISSTSQTLQTGFSPALGAGGIGCNCGNGSAMTTIGACSSLASGGGSNCGFSGDDKNTSHEGQFTECTEIFGMASRYRAAAGARGRMAWSALEYFRLT